MSLLPVQYEYPFFLFLHDLLISLLLLVSFTLLQVEFFFVESLGYQLLVRTSENDNCCTIGNIGRR